MKIITFYLPQFHRIKENDEWWGEGFTEWTNTRKAKPLYKTHYQPKEPLNNYYYDLLDDNTKIWQANLANKYGIDGFCFYHYWFDGKLLLEKPLEQLLENKKIQINYCVSWANEPWARTWDGLEKEVLMPQRYGNKDDWKKHFNYLMPFFKDKRYIKVNNKPMILLYRVNSIEKYDEMIEYWIELAKKEGFNGLHIVETLSRFQKQSVSEYSEAVNIFEPSYTTANEYNKFTRLRVALKKVFVNKGKGVRYIKTNDYDLIWKKILKRKVESKDKKIYLGGFVSWDNTARKGNKASIIEGGNPQKFKKYLRDLIIKAKKMNSDYVFINAWNEWAEGTYLEPDKLNEYKYLEAVKQIKEEMESIDGKI